MPTKTAAPPAKKPGTALVKWSEKLAALAQKAVRTEAGTGSEGNFISTKGGILTYQGAAIPGNKMSVIVVDHILENAYRPGKFDPANPQSPICYAFGREVEEMRPHPDSPEKQSETCEDCEQNKFGSAETGKGMACSSNCRRLALLPESALKDGIATTETAYLHLSYFSSKAWKGYVRELNDSLQKPALAVLTEMHLVPDAKAQFKFNFRLIEELDEEHFDELWKRYETVSKSIDFPYVQIEAVPAPPARGNGAKKKSKF